MGKTLIIPSGVNMPYIGVTCYDRSNMKGREVTLLDNEVTVHWAEKEDIIKGTNVAWEAVRRPSRIKTNSEVYCVLRNQSIRSNRCILV